MIVTGKTEILGLLGYPLGHSISFQMQNAALGALKRNSVYLPFPVLPDQFEEAVKGLLALPNFRGANVTIPYKERAMALCQELDEASRVIGAVNVVVVRAGKIIGANTDWEGFLGIFESAGVSLLTMKKALVLGAGGGGRAVVYALLKNGFKVLLFDCDRPRAEKLASDFKWGDCSVLNKDALVANVEAVDLVVNATSCGMFPHVEVTPFDGFGPVGFKKGQTVVDIVYNPMETKLLKKARAEGALGFGGLDMLISQGAHAFQIFTGEAPPMDVMKKAAQGALYVF